MTHFPSWPPRLLQYHFLFWTWRITEKITGELDALSICHSTQSSRSLSYHEYSAKKYCLIFWQLWSFPVRRPCAVIQIYQSKIDGPVLENFITHFLITFLLFPELLVGGFHFCKFDRQREKTLCRFLISTGPFEGSQWVWIIWKCWHGRR